MFLTANQPKCGFLPDSELIAAKNVIKKKVSRFAMHQTLKHSKGQVLPFFQSCQIKPLMIHLAM
jgi:hypothetical protein